MPLIIAEIPALSGTLGLCPMPGRTGDYPGDLTDLLTWRPTLVLTLTSKFELATKGAATLPGDLAAQNVAWRHLPIPDFGTPKPASAALWPATSTQARTVLANGGRVLVHCMGGCGRSGMVALRLLTDACEDPDTALTRLRAARPCAIETKAQHRWASAIRA
jgi:protein-tyrosine phosphatase